MQQCMRRLVADINGQISATVGKDHPRPTVFDKQGAAVRCARKIPFQIGGVSSSVPKQEEVDRFFWPVELKGLSDVLLQRFEFVHCRQFFLEGKIRMDREHPDLPFIGPASVFLFLTARLDGLQCDERADH